MTSNGYGQFLLFGKFTSAWTYTFISEPLELTLVRRQSELSVLAKLCVCHKVPMIECADYNHQPCRGSLWVECDVLVTFCLYEEVKIRLHLFQLSTQRSLGQLPRPGSHCVPKLCTKLSLHTVGGDFPTSYNCYFSLSGTCLYLTSLLWLI